jgi:hypothetical protein
MKVFSRSSTAVVDTLAANRKWYRTGLVIAFAALIAAVGITVSAPDEPRTAPGGTTGVSAPWSASFSLVATGWWTPDPAQPPAAAPTEAPPPAAPPAAAPPVAAPPAAAPPVAAPPAAAPPVAAPPAPSPPELVLDFDGPLKAVVQILHNANTSPVGCVITITPVAGPATMVKVPDVHFSVTGSERTPVDLPPGPATGSTFHDTVTCDNGLSTARDGTY